MTTQSNAELREAIKQIFKKRVDEAAKFMNPKFSYHGSYDADIDELLALFQAREQQLLTELLEASSPFGKNKVWAVPVAVIQRYREGL